MSYQILPTDGKKKKKKFITYETFFQHIRYQKEEIQLKKNKVYWLLMEIAIQSPDYSQQHLKLGH